jgi:hypothetical protein
MYKDYRNGEGNSVETIPGFRRRFTAPNNERINGIHEFDYVTSDGERKKDVLVHAGGNIYLWSDIKYTVNTIVSTSVVLGEPNDSGDIVCDLDDVVCVEVNSVEIGNDSYS